MKIFISAALGIVIGIVFYGTAFGSATSTDATEDIISKLIEILKKIGVFFLGIYKSVDEWLQDKIGFSFTKLFSLIADLIVWIFNALIKVLVWAFNLIF